MTFTLFEINNREAATLIWLAAFLLLAKFFISTRDFRDFLRALFAPKSFLVFLALALYAAAVTYHLQKYDLWHIGLLKETATWYFTAGISTLFLYVTAGRQHHFFRKLLWGALSLTTVAEFLLGEFVLSLPWELLLVPVSTLLVGIIVTAGHRKEYQRTKRVANIALCTLVLILLGRAFVMAIQQHSTLFTKETLKDFFIGPFLTFLSIPFFTLLSLISAYEQEFINLEARNPKLANYAKWQTLLLTHFSHKKLLKLRGSRFAKSIIAATSKKDIREAIVAAINRKDPEILTAEIKRIIVDTVAVTTEKRSQKVRVDFKNTSDKPIAVVDASIHAYGAQGQKLESSVERYTIFAAYSEAGRIQPGEIYKTPKDSGFMLASNVYGNAEHVEVRIVGAFEEIDPL